MWVGFGVCICVWERACDRERESELERQSKCVLVRCVCG